MLRIGGRGYERDIRGKDSSQEHVDKTASKRQSMCLNETSYAYIKGIHCRWQWRLIFIVHYNTNTWYSFTVSLKIKIICLYYWNCVEEE